MYDFSTVENKYQESGWFYTKFIERENPPTSSHAEDYNPLPLPSSLFR